MKNETNKISSMRQRTHNGVDNIMDKAESMSEGGREKIALLKENATRMKGNIDGYIQKNPERSVLIAAGVGMAAGTVLAATLMRRRN